MEHPKILVISHNCLSKSGSNGRTLLNLLKDWPVSCLAQFYIHNEIPDAPMFNNFFRITDYEALAAFCKGDIVGKVIKKSDVNNFCKRKLQKIYPNHRNKTALNYLARNLVWNSGRWRSERFYKWLIDFNPDLILLQIGDYEFMFRIALSIGGIFRIPIIIYNSEDYYFKDKKSNSPLFHLYRFIYKKQFEKVLNYSSHSIYSCEMLQDTYKKVFTHESSVLMIGSLIKRKIIQKTHDVFIVSYFGNLGVGRHVPLVELAEAFVEVNETIRLDVYGKPPNNEVKFILEECEAIRYHGPISYEEVMTRMQKSDLLVHVENFSSFYQWDLKHAFSTKIADCLSSGTCFFVYAPETIACTQYLKLNNAACVVTNKDQLKEHLRKLINDKSLRQKYVENALRLAAKNHNSDANIRAFKEIVCKTTMKR